MRVFKAIRRHILVIIMGLPWAGQDEVEGEEILGTLEAHEHRHGPECCREAEPKCWGCSPGEKPTAASPAQGSLSQMPPGEDGDGSTEPTRDCSY